MRERSYVVRCEQNRLTDATDSFSTLLRMG